MRYHPNNLAISKSLGLLTTATKTREVGWSNSLPLSNTCISIEFFYHCVNLWNLPLNIAPVVRVIPLGLNLSICFALLLNPGKILQIVNSFAVCIGQLKHMLG